jgi:glycogen operon protein
LNRYAPETGKTTDIRTGRPEPLGASWDGSGVNFAIFSEYADGIDLCLFAKGVPDTETARIPLTSKTGHIWHAYIPGLRPGQLYGYRAHGPYSPAQGFRFNPGKLLLDPYAKAISGGVNLSEIHLDYRKTPKGAEPAPDTRDSAAYMPKSVVIDGSFDWGKDSPPDIPVAKTVIYELHVRGFTALHPLVPEELRGTYAGLTVPPVLDHLRSLGVTTLELMPVHQSVSEKRLLENGLGNYWGYNSIGYFAPDIRFSSAGAAGGQVAEFKDMVKTLHGEGFEIILDVVYNHTAEGGAAGPTLSFRGIDNAYYRFDRKHKGQFANYTGCGNTVNAAKPEVWRLITGSLRYWVTEMHVDGFRFDLATALFREDPEYNRSHTLFGMINRDPVLSKVKLIAEPWDLGPAGYQAGNFPDPWSEWNDRYRNTVRRFWRGDRGQLGDLAYRISGSSDLYGARVRGPYTGINYVTSHDGFTLNDLVTYEKKHNEANLENNMDGTDSNYSCNFGVEGPSEDPAIKNHRDRQKRNLIATLFLSQGIPMLAAGDEIGRTQRGNNNAYCQDNGISWVNWTLGPSEKELLEFTRFMVDFRKKHPILNQGKFFHGNIVKHNGFKDLIWFRKDGNEMTNGDWQNGSLLSMGLIKSGDNLTIIRRRGKPGYENTLMLLLNAEPGEAEFVIPSFGIAEKWQTVIETASSRGPKGPRRLRSGYKYIMAGRSLTVMKPIYIIKQKAASR